jgi:hypothetical protein
MTNMAQHAPSAAITGMMVEISHSQNGPAKAKLLATPKPALGHFGPKTSAN